MSLSSQKTSQQELAFKAKNGMRPPLTTLLKQKAWPILTVVSGATLEYYAYMLLAVMLGDPTFLDQFFSSDSAELKILKGYAFFTICALCRPLGALIFGWIGDKYGRKTALFGSLTLMGGSCFLIAGLPTYETAGVYAVAFLFFARVAQIISASGETNGAPIFLIEHFGITRAGLGSGLAYFGTMTGSALATLAAAYFSGGSWRYAFLIGGMAGVIAIFVRFKLKESKEFTQASKHEEPEAKLEQKFTSYLVVLVISACCSGVFYFSSLFLAKCWQQLAPSCEIGHINNLRAGLVWFYAITTLLGGFLSDYFKIFRIMRIGGIMLLITIPAFLYSITLDPNVTYLNISLYGGIMLALGIFAGPSHSFMYRFFPPKSRYKSVSLCYSIATATIGAGTPAVSYYLFTSTQSALGATIWIIPIILSAYASLRTAEKIWNKRSQMLAKNNIPV